MASSAPCILAVEGGDIDLLRALCLVRMLGAGIDAQIAELLAAERSARQHPLRMLAIENLCRSPLLDAAGITGVPVIDLVGALVAGEHDLGGVDDDNVVAAIHMWREARLVLASEPRGDHDRKSANDEAIGIDEDPGLLDVLGRR